MGRICWYFMMMVDDWPCVSAKLVWGMGRRVTEVQLSIGTGTQAI
jgi:hypothetical protein